jgi:hypothetical protein
MKKTLLLTTALIGTLSVLNSAQAEVKIGAHVKTAWKSMENTTATGANLSGFSQERQIDVSTSGTLNNGLKYAAGFSLEQDGGQTGFDGSEGNYVNVSFGNTTLELGNDHILNGDYNIVPRAGNALNEEIDGKLDYGQNVGTIKESMGLGVVQKIDNMGTLAVNFVPKVSKASYAFGSPTSNSADYSVVSSSTDTAVKAETSDTAVSGDVGKSGYELMFAGDLGMKGLNVALNYVAANFDGTNGLQTKDQKVVGFGMSYTAGPVAVGFEKVNAELFAGDEKDMLEIGAVYKIADNASIGVGRTKTEYTATTGVKDPDEETINYLQVGYNLGAIGTQFSYISGSNMKHDSTVSQKAYVFKVNTKF